MVGAATRWPFPKKGWPSQRRPLVLTLETCGPFSKYYSTVRKVVNQLRNDGNPICSGDNGYYYAADRKELLASIGQMTSRIREIAKAKRGLVKALEHFPDANGQMRLDLDKEVRER